MDGKFYIAYGSNLSIEQMKVRTPDAVIVGTGILKDWQLLFRTFATIKKRKGFSVPVLVWKISPQDEKNLDRYEGYPKFYVKKNLKIDVTGLNGNHFGEVNAMVYIMTKKATDTRSINPIPRMHYYSILRSGYKRFGFDGKILTEALLEAARQCSPQI
ncbi:MAG: gamma-glutamylcyclotransferase [Synergistaceae bacterium]|nr:gamma-glutamylcyclotransferase [Synergistaceae bacterium]